MGNQNPTSAQDDHRTGPATPVTQNKHNMLFRKQAPALNKVTTSPKGTDDRDCFNCGEKGHIAKDCPHPKRPRRMRTQNKRAIWRNRLTSFMAELTKDEVGPFTEEQQQSMTQQVDAMVAAIPVLEGGEEEDEGAHLSNPVQEDPIDTSKTTTPAEQELAEHQQEIQALTAELQEREVDTQEYGYENFYIQEVSAMHADVSMEDPVAKFLQLETILR